MELDQDLQQVGKLMDMVTEFAVQYGFQILGALIFLVIGLKVASWAGKKVNNICLGRDMDQTLSGFIGNIVKILVIAFVAIATLSNFGISIAPLIALAGAGVGHLTGGLGQVNIAASVMFGGISGSAAADASAIGGLKEKLLAALRGGITKVLIPVENAKDLPEIPDNVKAGLEIVPVTHVREVLEHALVRQPQAIDWDAEAEEAAMLARLNRSEPGSSATAH